MINIALLRPMDDRNFAQHPVGADAHIGPLGSYEFAEDYRKNGAICRADVGIGPYTETSGAYVCAVFFHKKALLPAGRTESSAPTQTLKSCAKTWAQQFFDRLRKRSVQTHGAFSIIRLPFPYTKTAALQRRAAVCCFLNQNRFRTSVRTMNTPPTHLVARASLASRPLFLFLPR